MTNSLIWPLVIELGGFKIESIVPLNEVLWFITGLLLLISMSTAVLWWNRHSRPDPFA
jgi:hypothetical protein